MKCEMVLCVDAGPAHDLKWCPLPSHDDVNISVLDAWEVLNSAYYSLTLQDVHANWVF